MISVQFRTANRNSRLPIALFALLILGALSGCGGGWQPDPRDTPRSPTRSGTEGSGFTGPGDSRTNL